MFYVDFLNGQNSTTPSPSHQLEAVVKGEPAIMSSIIDNINAPSAWNAALPIFQAIWSMLVYEWKFTENSEKQYVNVLDRVDGSSTYALKQIKLKKCEGLGSFLEYPRPENRTLIYNILAIEPERAESVFDSGKAILKNDNNNDVFLNKKFEIILLALIFWFRKLSENQMRVFEDELSVVVESIVFMAVHDQKKIDFGGKKDNKVKPMSVHQHPPPKEHTHHTQYQRRPQTEP